MGFTEIPKPPALQARGGAWFTMGEAELHVGVEEPFQPAHKAHPAFVWDDIDTLAGRLQVAGYPTVWDDLMEGRRRFYTTDPFDNRLEFIGAV